MAESILDRLRLLMGSEETPLAPSEELEFQSWAADNAPGYQYPDNRYDTRGFWLENPSFNREKEGHSTDKFKQRGHPTFSTESKYAKGNQDAGHWVGEFFQPPIQRTGLPSHAEGNPNYIAKPLDYTFDQNPGLKNSMAIPADMDKLIQLLMNRKR